MVKRSGSIPAQANSQAAPETTIRRALRDDVPELLVLMREFYRCEQIAFDAERQRTLLHELIAEPALGDPMVLLQGRALIGYFVLAHSFSLEFGGRFTLLDELYVAPAFRGGGHAGRAIEAALAQCCERGIGALRLEVSDGNEAAARLYQRHHFRPDRRLMTRRLERP